MCTRLTISAGIQVNHTSNAYVDHAQKALILLLELLLIEDLYRKYALVIDSPVCIVSLRLLSPATLISVHVKTLVPIRIQRLLDDASRARLLAADGSHREWVWESCILNELSLLRLTSLKE